MAERPGGQIWGRFRPESTRQQKAWVSGWGGGVGTPVKGRDGAAAGGRRRGSADSTAAAAAATASEARRLGAHARGRGGGDHRALPDTRASPEGAREGGPARGPLRGWGGAEQGPRGREDPAARVPLQRPPPPVSASGLRAEPGPPPPGCPAARAEEGAPRAPRLPAPVRRGRGRLAGP